MKAGLPGTLHQGGGPSPGPWRTRRVGQAEGQWSAGINISEDLTPIPPPECQYHEGQGPLFCPHSVLYLELNICGMPEWTQDHGLGRILSCTRHNPWGWVRSGVASPDASGNQSDEEATLGINTYTVVCVWWGQEDTWPVVIVGLLQSTRVWAQGGHIYSLVNHIPWVASKYPHDGQSTGNCFEQGIQGLFSFWKLQFLREETSWTNKIHNTVGMALWK